MISLFGSKVHPARSRPSRAFTLVEVLLAVAILSGAIVFVLRSFMASLSAVRLSQDMTQACFLAEGILWSAEDRGRLGIPAASARGAGRLTLEGRDFEWSYESVPAEPAAPQELSVKVGWRQKAQGPARQLEFLTCIQPRRL